MRVKIVNCSLDDENNYKKEIGNIFKVKLNGLKHKESFIELEDLNGYSFCVLAKDILEVVGYEGFIFLENIPVSPKFKDSIEARYSQFFQKGFKLDKVIWIGHQTDWLDGRVRPEQDQYVKYIVVLKDKDRIVKFEETVTTQFFYQSYGKVEI